MFTVTRESAGLTAAVPVKVFGSVHPGHSEGEDWLCELGPAVLTHEMPGPSYPAHDHDHYELTFVVRGRGVHETEYGSVEVGPGSVHILAPGEAHSYTDTEGLVKVKCAYLGEWLLNDLHELLSEGHLIPLFMHTVLGGLADRTGPAQWAIERDVWNACAYELRDIAVETAGPHPSLVRMKSALKKMMVVLDRSSTEWGGLPCLDSHAAPWMRWTLGRIEETILQGGSFSVSALSRELGMGSKAFGRAFQQVVGSSPTQYYQHRRVQRACWLLLHSGKSITEIAYLLGYSDSAHFTRVFRRVRGTVPSEYRERYEAS